MNTLIIYDETGKIYFQASGNVEEPSGIPFIWSDIPDGYYAKSVNVSAAPNLPILREIGALDPDTCALEELKTYLIAKSNSNLEEYLKNNPITSSCHGGIEKQYSITKDKQAYLTQEIAVTQMAIQNNVEYQPSWNATGERCTYDWTLAELQQLAFEIAIVVKPQVSKQQSMEEIINDAETKEAVLAISIEF
jgi:hypothetical protein